jgi:flagellar protein FlaI
MDALLRVDDECPGKTLKKPLEDERAKMPEGTEDRVDECISSSPQSVPVSDPIGVNVAGENDACGNCEVVHNYTISRWCSAQILWDHKAGQHRYELIEPQMATEEKKAFDDVVSELRKKPRAELARMRLIGGRERILEKFERICGERGIGVDLKEKMRYYLERDFWGYKKIHSLLMDPNVEDVSCNGYKKPVYAYLPGLESVQTSVRFDTEEEMDDFVMYLVQKGGKSISAASPIQDVALPDGSRLNATLYREVSSGGTTFSIRLANRARGAAELLRNGTFSPESLAFLWLAMESRCSMAFIGGTASGKTAALNAVSGFIMEKNKVVTIEDTREVRLASRNWTPLVARTHPPITEFDLLVAAFRQRPEYVIVGEVRTPEGARAAIHGINSGHTVIMTFHADSPQSFFNRLTDEPFNISPHIASGLSLCVSLAMVSLRTGGPEIKARRCISISEVRCVEAGRVKTQPLFEWDPACDAILIRPVESCVMEKIKAERCWSDSRLIKEIAARASVLRWMAGNMVTGEDDVRRVIETFSRDRPRLMKLIEACGRIEDLGASAE